MYRGVWVFCQAVIAVFEGVAARAKRDLISASYNKTQRSFC
jgi:hypothetical protein